MRQGAERHAGGTNGRAGAWRCCEEEAGGGAGRGEAPPPHAAVPRAGAATDVNGKAAAGSAAVRSWGKQKSGKNKGKRQGRAVEEPGRRPRRQDRSRAWVSLTRVEETRCGQTRACSARPHTPAQPLPGPGCRAPGRTALPPHRYRPGCPHAPLGTGTRGRSPRSGLGEPRPRPSRGLRMRAGRLGRARSPGKGTRAGGGCDPAAPPSQRRVFFAPKTRYFSLQAAGRGPLVALGVPVRGGQLRAVRRRLQGAEKPTWSPGISPWAHRPLGLSP